MQNSLLYLALARALSRERWAEADSHRTSPQTAPATAPTARWSRFANVTSLRSRQPRRLALSSPMGCTT